MAFLDGKDLLLDRPFFVPEVLLHAEQVEALFGEAEHVFVFDAFDD